MSTESKSLVYPLGPDSEKQEGVPEGKTFQVVFDQSTIFPGTTREITVYVPAQYDASKAACVYVGLDGLGCNVQTVFDNLIHKGEMPVTIAIGVSSGKVQSVNENVNPRFNRSFEFDGLNDALARCLVDEVFPAVEKMKTPDGLPIVLSNNPNDRCAGGGSTGGVGSFTLAWERPDLFRRVFTAIGTFVGMRGADRYPIIVRKTEPKPIRIFQQDGENDQCMGEIGDWWMSNLIMERALEFSGYDHQHVWGTGAHDMEHASAIFPDAMRFLWKGWPEPIRARLSKSKNGVLNETLDLNETWQLVDEAGDGCDYPVVNPQGEVYFYKAGSLHKIGLDGKLTDERVTLEKQAFGFATDGRLVTVGGINSICLTVAFNGNIYATDSEVGKVWLIEPDGNKILLDKGLNHPTGIALSPDGLWLLVMESGTHLGYNYRVISDGRLELKQPFFWMHIPDWTNGSGAGGMCMDREGRAYVATHMGVQVLDRNGRSRLILPMPTGQAATGVCFGGPQFDLLFATSGGKLFHRRMKMTGAPSFFPPITLPSWSAG